MRRMYHINRDGFTLVELMVVVVIIGVILPVIAAILIYTYRDAFISTHLSNATSEARRALWFMDDDVRLAGRFLTRTGSNFADAYGPHNLGSSGAQAWSYRGDSADSRVLITQNFSTNDNSGGNSRRPVYTNEGKFNCSTTEITFQPELTYTTIYFVHDSTLYRRILTDKTTPLCSDPSPTWHNQQSQLQSCPPYITSARDASCQANDEIIATNVSKFDVKYFQLSGDDSHDPVDPSYNSSDPLVLDAADFVEVTLSITSENGQYTRSMTQRITKVNQI